MSRVTKHADLRNSSCLNSFLQVDDATFSQVKEQCKQDREKASGSLSTWFENKVNAMTTTNTQVFIYFQLKWMAHSYCMIYVCVCLRRGWRKMRQT